MLAEDIQGAWAPSTPYFQGLLSRLEFVGTRVSCDLNTCWLTDSPISVGAQDRTSAALL